MSASTVSPIKLQLRDLAQLFNSMDPSPFHDRDLDADAEEFILSWARELPQAQEIELLIHLPMPPSGGDRSADVERAVQHYFSERLEMKRREFRQLMRRGRSSLAIGLSFLGACLFGSEMATEVATRPLSLLVGEGLLIVGWVAMWRPLEIYLYDWWPLRDERRMLERLTRVKVHIVTPPAPPANQSRFHAV
jgi:hypothetical protein